MPLGLSDLDPEIAERVKAKDLEARRFATFGAMESARRAMAKDEETKRAFAAEVRLSDAIQAETLTNRPDPKARFRRSALIVTLTILCLGLLNGLSAFMAPSIASKVALSALSLGVLVAAGMALGNHLTSTSEILIQHAKREKIPLPTLIALLQSLGRDEIDTAYGHSAAMILEGAGSLGENTARKLLLALNDLLTAARRLEAEKSAMDAAMTRQSLVQIETERDGLQARIEASSDSIAKETLTESLTQCEARLVRARGLAPLQERIDAQLLGISQTMRSVQSSVASLKLAPSANADLDALRETACELAGRTKAIENAVQEVLSIRF